MDASNPGEYHEPDSASSRGGESASPPSAFTRTAWMLLPCHATTNCCPSWLTKGGHCRVSASEISNGAGSSGCAEASIRRASSVFPAEAVRQIPVLQPTAAHDDGPVQTWYCSSWYHGPYDSNASSGETRATVILYDDSLHVTTKLAPFQATDAMRRDSPVAMSLVAGSTTVPLASTRTPRISEFTS